MGQVEKQIPIGEHTGNTLYTTKDVQTATGLSSPHMVRRYIRRFTNNPKIERPYSVVNLGRGPKMLLPEDTFRQVVGSIIDIRGVPIEQPETFPDGKSVPPLKSKIQKRLLIALLKAREEERFFHMQELPKYDLNNVPLEVEGWSFSFHVNNLNRNINGSGWTIQGGHRVGHEKNQRGRKYSYFLRRENESLDGQSNPLLIKMQIKEQVLATATHSVLSQLVGAHEKQSLNQNINILLYDALKRNFPDAKKLTQIFTDTSVEYLKTFFLNGFIYTLQTVPERGTAYLSEEEKQILGYLNSLRQNHYDIQRIVGFVKAHFGIRIPDSPQSLKAA